MKNWRQWGKRIGGLLRRLLARLRQAWTGEPAQRPARPDVAAPAEPREAPGPSASAGPIAPQADQAVAPPLPSMLVPGSDRLHLPSAPIPVPAPDEAAPAPVSEVPGKWLKEAISVAAGRIDLAPWVLPARTYRIYEPSVLAEHPCLLLVLHGCQQSAEDIAEGTRMNEHADERGWLVVYPEQTKLANKNNCWNWFDPANNRGEGECALIAGMQDAVRARYGLDRAPTLLAGMSAGGALASLLALRFPERWAAVAIHSGLPYGAATDPWGALRAMREGALNLADARALRLAAPAAPPVRAIILHGSEDAVVNRRNANLLVRQFLGWNGYFSTTEDWESAPLTPTEVSKVKTRYGHPYILRDYSQPGLAPVRECEVTGMGHAWSGGDNAQPFHDELGPDASTLMVEFFAGIVAASSASTVGVLH